MLFFTFSRLPLENWDGQNSLGIIGGVGVEYLSLFTQEEKASSFRACQATYQKTQHLDLSRSLARDVIVPNKE